MFKKLFWNTTKCSRFSLEYHWLFHYCN